MQHGKRDYDWELNSWELGPHDSPCEIWVAHDGLCLKISGNNDLNEAAEITEPAQLDDLIDRLQAARVALWGEPNKGVYDPDGE